MRGGRWGWVRIDDTILIAHVLLKKSILARLHKENYIVCVKIKSKCDIKRAIMSFTFLAVFKLGIGTRDEGACKQIWLALLTLRLLEY